LFYIKTIFKLHVTIEHLRKLRVSLSFNYARSISNEFYKKEVNVWTYVGCKYWCCIFIWTRVYFYL